MGIFDLDAYLGKVLKEKIFLFTGEVNTSSLSVKNATVYGLEISESKPQETMFIGESELNNDSPETQPINSDSFTKTITDSVTTSVTNGFSAGVEISIGGKIFGMGVETSMSFEVSTSTTNEQTSEESVAYTVPSQTITVPAHSKRYVYTALERSQLEGIMRLKADLSGQFLAYLPVDSVAIPFDLYEFVRESHLTHPLPSGISLNHNDKSIY